ncbi:hypothetical protein [uncultured Jannaschia sp.]|uniref:hypothetical protein n=1 Tax=uncultured Jannaschia sp. TaxID=293347 RepID=UPI00261EBDB1|nr:hypothetical protein [uncultured Jannaschia sp.]
MKTVKLVLAAAILTGAPGLALAQGCSYGKQQSAQMSCAPGTTLNAETGTCVPVTG